MQNLFLSFVFIVLIFPSYAQIKNPATEFKVNWGTPYEIPKKYEDLGYLSNMQDGILQICVKMNNDVIFQRFDLNKFKPVPGGLPLIFQIDRIILSPICLSTSRVNYIFIRPGIRGGTGTFICR